ncbi:MAG: ArsR/SmtB family transcription factor [Leptolyngbyaceae cyanobacterium]
MLTNCFQALSHPVRLQLLQVLATRPGCICGDVIEIGAFSKATILEHLRVLQRAGFIQGELEGRRRCYQLDSDTFDTFKRLVDQL